MKENSNTVIYPSLFENDYIQRSLGPIVRQPDIALTELVANAWDAGASQVTISIPENINQRLCIEDNGTGMSEDEFQNRWMKLRYNRLLSQGRLVVFPEENLSKRVAFGRNGVGRHGMFCFGDEYVVITRKGGKENRYTVRPNVESNAFAVVGKETTEAEGHGTRLEVVVTKNLPKPEKMAELLSARFLHDPQFTITVNHTTLDIVDLLGDTLPQDVVVPQTNIKLTLYFVDTTKTGRKSIYQGIAFWQGGRLVGEPSWTIGDTMVLDGRTSLAKRYTFIVKSDDLSEFIKEDWSGFKKCEEMVAVYQEVEKFVNESFESISSQTAAIIKENIKNSFRESLGEINPLMRCQIDSLVDDMVYTNPKVKQESVDLAIKTVINLEKTQNGHELLQKIAQLKPEDIDGLNQLLDKWTINDALTVLNEIDRRLAVITAIRKLSGDKNTDELHVLHPLIAESRWLFGPEYESSEYIFNRQMKTVVEKVFKNCEFVNPDTNYQKRPDLVCLPNSSLSITGLEEMSSEIGLDKVRSLLVIELKKGGFKLTREERNQAQGYVEDLMNSSLGDACLIKAFVVGDSVAANLESHIKVGDRGSVIVTNYAQLVDTAERRMFGLRSKISARYDDVPGMTLYAQAMLPM